MEIYKNTKEQEGLYESIRFMPNINDLNNNILSFDMMDKTQPNMVPTKKYMSYILKEGKVIPYYFGITIKKHLDYALTGFYGTEDGQYITQEGRLTEDGLENPTKVKDRYIPSCWYGDKNGCFITEFNDRYESIFIDDKFEIDYNKKQISNLIKYNKVIKYDPFVYNDIRKGKTLNYQIKIREGYLELYKRQWVDSSSLLTEEQSKEDILKLYEGVPKLEDYLEFYKKELKTKFPNLIFDEEVKLVRNEYFKNRRKETLPLNDNM